MSNRVAVLRAGYEAFNRRDIEAMLEMMHPDVDFYPSPRVLDIGGRYRGREGVREMLAAFHDAFERYLYEAQRFTENGDHVAVLGRFHALGRGSGVEVQGDFAHIHHFRGATIIRWDGDTERNLEVIDGWG